MIPAQYAERIPTYTGVQWDGSPEARTWILDAYAGQARAQDEDILITGAVWDDTLVPGTWVLRDDREGATPVQVSDAAFALMYKAV